MRPATLGLLVVLSTQALVACKKPDPAVTEVTSAAAPAPIKVQVAAVEELPMPEHLVLTGTLRASQESEVAADAAGKVTATFVERGQRVKQGDTLAILDARGASISASAANAQTQLAKAQLEQAQRECDRVKALKDSGAISQAEYDRVTSQCQTTQWSAAAAQAQQQSAQKIVGDSVIRAPFPGVIGERSVNVGQYVQPSTRVATLYTPDPLRLELTVPEANVAGIKPEQPVVFTVSAFGDEKFSGTVKFISPNVRPTTRDLVIEAFCPNVDLKLKPGMFAVARLETAEKPLPAIPLTALAKQADVARAFAVVEKRVEERIVQLGAERDGKIAVLAGLKPGEQVVVSPGPDVRDGAQVQ
ncbi:MAG: efflux RND transporter periplasmic adaptor subunit [Labilithrix sp.]|nr:efflux RND transporter periplasmic adaptor subunit [Labilithrix sp.]MCW5832761.1 efflux RND transporter periplasmic adaptor subunit [Labilithrix sp.]